MTLIWETDGNLVRHYVDWGRTNIAENIVSQIETLQIDTSHYVHRATIPGLAVETSYVYRVRSGTNVTAAYSFMTAPRRSTPFVTAWWGDNHGGTTTLARHVTNLLAHAPNMICVAGDMVNSGNSISEWHDYWFKPLETLNAAQTTPVIYARGNHDGEHALAYAYSTLPGNEAWFAFDYGNSRFIFLDSEVSTSTSADQFDWLQTELSRPETQQAAFRIVCFHRPPYVNLWNGGGHTGEDWVQTDWVPLFTQKNVDLVIGGHMHAYQRGATNGVMYVVSGGGGGVLDTERVAFWPFVQVEYSQYHFDIMEISGGILSWETYNTSNQLLDMFTLTSRIPTLTWQRPGASDGAVPLTVTGKPGASYVLESSPDLVNWIAYATNTVLSSAQPRFTNSIPVNLAVRFIRARTSL
jgi:predicted phosphodiesterase